MYSVHFTMYVFVQTGSDASMNVSTLRRGNGNFDRNLTNNVANFLPQFEPKIELKSNDKVLFQVIRLNMVKIN